MEKILDFTQPYNVALFDQVVAAAFGGSPQEIQTGQKVLAAFKQNPNAWHVSKAILEQSRNPQAKYLALQVLEDVILYKWKILSAEDREGMKNFIIVTVVNSCKDERQMQADRLCINKLNEVLVQIVKQEWPQNWKNFIPEIVSSSKLSELLCRNNMKILKLLSEEVFDFSGGKMTQDKIIEKKTGLKDEFAQIYELCDFVLKNASNSGLISSTLQTLQSFIHWISPQYIFETQMLEALIMKFLPVEQFRNDVIRCLTEIASLTNHGYNNHLALLFKTVMTKIVDIIPPNTDIPRAHRDGNENTEQFISALGLFLTTFFKNHLPLVENDALKGYLIQAHFYLVSISEVDDKELFKTCLEYWDYLAQSLYFSEKKEKEQQGAQHSSLMLGYENMPTQRQAPYAEVLSRLRTVLISKMAKPEEVIIVEDENGQVIKEYMKDVDSIALYKNMKETLIYLTHLNAGDTERIMLRKLQDQMNQYGFNRNNLNTLCWAIGSISGAMDVRDEKRFLVSVIKDLLNLCENAKGKENKAVVASNIMYVVGQYPRFLLEHWKFLKTVVNKLFEFMHESFPGVQEMACETFVKLAKKCRRKFVTTQAAETRPFVEDILQDLLGIISDLEPSHVQVFYEAIGHMIQSADPQYQEPLIAKLMTMPNARWSTIMTEAMKNAQSLTNNEVVRDLVNLLKTNVCTAKSVGSSFISQISRIFREMLEVYKLYSTIITEEIKRVGPIVTQHANVKMMRAVKKEVLKLVETFIVSAKNTQVVAQSFIPPLLEATLGDYHMSVNEAKDPGVLSLLSVAINKLKEEMLPYLPRIVESVLECTLPLITKNFEDFPEHRVNLFNLLRAINKHCFQSFFQISSGVFKLIIDSVLWAVKHQHTHIFETGLNILLEMLTNVSRISDVNAQSSFYRSFFLSILHDVFYVLTDTMHKSAFDIEAAILFHLFGILQTGKVSVPVYDTTGMQSLPSNQDYIKNDLANMLPKTFPNLTPQQVYNFITALFESSNNEEQFKVRLRDFLVQMKEYSEYFLQAELEKRKQAEERTKRESVPGLADAQDSAE